MGTLSLPLDAVARAYACVVFAKRRVSGCVLLVATLLCPVSGLVTLWSVIVATALALQLGYARSAIERGHYGYNAVLIGLAIAHGRGLSLELLLVAAGGAAVSVLLTAVLSDIFWRGAGLPVLAVPALLLLGPVQRWQQLHGFSPNDAPPPVFAMTHSLGAEVDHVLRACGAILFDPSRATGGLVLLALLLYSRVATLLALGGIACATLLTRALDVAPNGSVALAASYNAGLTAVAIGATLFVPGRASLLAALPSAVCAAFGCVAVSQTKPAFSVWAWPFVVSTLVALRALRLRGSSHALSETLLPLATPEQNREYAAMLRVRFGSQGNPTFVLPFSGTWFVSQGVNGEHTHRGPWAHALDFEVVNSEGFPFRGQGERLQDYYCYGRPALAPGSGSVVAVHDRAPEQAPGSQDTLSPWGNVVVLQHGPELFSVLAHLQSGAMLVKPGDFVAAGQPLGRVGSSGRSPRPHLHFQVQRTSELGAATLPFQLVGYGVQEESQAHFSAFGVPKQGTRVFSTERPKGAQILGLLPGAELECRCDGVPLKVRYELSLLGEHSLLDLERGDRVYFVPGPVLTTYVGKPGTPLATLYWAMPCLPVPDDLPMSFEERLMPGGSLSTWWAAFRSCAALLGVACDLWSKGHVERTDSQLLVQTRTELRIWKYVLASWWTSVCIGPRGLESISRSNVPLPRHRARARSELSPAENPALPAIEGTGSCH